MKRVLLLVTFALAVVAASALGKNQWMSPFNAEYNTAGTRLDDCNVCHSGGSRLNSYGDDFLIAYNQSGSVGAACQAVEGLDSDGDKVHNIIEIQHLTFPGDGSDTAPTRSATWGAIKALYN